MLRFTSPLLTRPLTCLSFRNHNHNPISASLVSRVLKNKKWNGGSDGGGHESKNDDLFQGINDISELAAVYDYYEVCC